MIQNGKATIKNEMGTLNISVPSKKNWFALLFGTAWLGGWFFGFKFASSQLFSGEQGSFGVDGFLTFWLAAWTCGGAMVIFLMLWGYFGRETFVSGQGEATLRKTIFGLGLKKRMEAREIKNFRMEAVNTSRFGNNRWAFWGFGPGKIKFDYGLKTYSFGLAVDDAEANYIVDILKRHFKL